MGWRDRVLYPFSRRLGARGIEIGAAFAFAEMLRHGITTVVDFFYVQGGGNANAEAAIRAAKQVGIRLVLARAFYDWSGAPPEYRETVDEATRRCRELMARVRGRSDRDRPAGAAQPPRRIAGDDSRRSGARGGGRSAVPHPRRGVPRRAGAGGGPLRRDPGAVPRSAGGAGPAARRRPLRLARRRRGRAPGGARGARGVLPVLEHDPGGRGDQAPGDARSRGAGRARDRRRLHEQPAVDLRGDADGGPPPEGDASRRDRLQGGGGVSAGHRGRRRGAGPSDRRDRAGPARGSRRARPRPSVAPSAERAHEERRLRAVAPGDHGRVGARAPCRGRRPDHDARRDGASPRRARPHARVGRGGDFRIFQIDRREA